MTSKFSRTAGLLASNARRRIPRNAYTRDFSENSAVESKEGWLFVDSVFPVRLGRWDIRHYFGLSREETLLSGLSNVLSSVQAHGFEVLSLEPHVKDGGVFVCFRYSGGNKEALEIERVLKGRVHKRGGLPSWLGVERGDLWLVKGSPWREDMNRFASPILKLSFEGPDIHEEALYKLLRPYGVIQDLAAPVPVPAGTLRSTTVTYKYLRSATIARNVVHGFTFSSNSASPTRLRTMYERPIKTHAVKDWLAGHPKIVLPVLVFLLGTLTYTIFDPIRTLMIEGKMENWFNYREYAIYKWLQAHALERFEGESAKRPKARGDDGWKERKEAVGLLHNYLADLPTTVAFIHGPQGSGKARMLNTLLQETDRKVLIIDCTELNKTTSDTQLIGALARQTGYRPVFTFLNSMNTLIDLASVGLIGQKAGMSTSLTDQLKQILGVTASALKRVSSSHRTAIQQQIKSEQTQAEESRRQERISRSTWHDGRLDCIAGNGVMSELGGGDEPVVEGDWDTSPIHALGATPQNDELERQMAEEVERKKRSAEDAQAVGSLPIVVIKNFAAKNGSTVKQEMLNVLAEWAASLAENQIAHVVVVSDNRENVKTLAKALPSKPLNTIALYDADAASALSFVKQKLHDAGIELEYTSAQTAYVERLGGRASDLERLVHKVRSGQQVEEAVEDIINRGVSELRKNAFGDDVEDAKGLPWTPEQAWAVLRQLAVQDEIPYYDILLEFPFKGNETPLRSMEHAELISIGTHNGRASTIRAGKPVFRYVFERLAHDPIFQATQDLVFNEKVIVGAESTIHTCEAELAALREVADQERRVGGGSWFSGRGAAEGRIVYLLEKMRVAESKIEILEKKNSELKKILKRGG